MADKRIKFSFIAISLLAPLLLLFLPSMETHLQPIPGYFQFRLLADEAPLFSYELNQNHIEHISPYNQFVDFNNYGQYERISVSDLSSRMDERDIRFDPYLKNLYSFFYQSDEKGSLCSYYIPSNKSSIITFLSLLSSFKVVKSLSFVGFRGFVYFYCFLLLSAYLVFFFIRYKRFRFLLFPFSFIMIVLLFTGSFFLIWSALIFWSLLFSYTDTHLSLLRTRFRLHKNFTRDEKRTAFISFLPVLLSLIAPLIIPSLPVVLFFCLIPVFLYFSAVGLLFLRRIKQKELGPGYTGMLVFPLFPKKNDSFKQFINVFIFHVVSMIVFSFVLIVHLNFISIPSVYKTLAFEKQSLSSLSVSAESSFPNLAQFFAHQAYQKDYLFGSSFADFYQRDVNSSSSRFNDFIETEEGGVGSSSWQGFSTFHFAKMDLKAYEKQFPLLINNERINLFTLTTEYALKSLGGLYRILIIINIGTVVFLFFIYFPIKVISRKRKIPLYMKEWA